MRKSMQHIAIAVVAAGLIAACADSEQGSVPTVGEVIAASPEQTKLQEILDRGSIRVGTTGDFYMSWKDPETGKRSGFDIELTTKLAEDMGVEVEFVTTDWTSLVSGLSAGRYDITTGASYTAGRARSASYTIPIVSIGTVALVREADQETYASWDRINQPDVIVAVRQGAMVEEYASDLVPNARISAIASPASAYAEVVSRRADVVLASLVDAAEHLAGGSTLRSAPVEPQNVNFVGLLVQQGHTELRSFVDAWIRAQECSGYLSDLAARYHLSF